jgi:drug/metabolite transporter (DMT)-like permease
LERFSGELAALGTSVFFGCSSTFFTLAGRRVGSLLVNRTRLLAATLLALSFHWLIRGEPLPWTAPMEAWVWLGLSGVIGLAIGDDLLFHAYVLVGPALSMLVFALAPVLTSLLGFVLLGETLSLFEWTGIATTMSGIGWVVTERKRGPAATTRQNYVKGLLFAFGGAWGQALGLITAKMGLSEISPQSGNVIRLLAATVATWALTALRGHLKKNLRALSQDRGAAGLAILGAIFGPFAGVWLSLVAIERAPVGIASTLMSLTPIVLLPISRIVFAEPITMRALVGTMVTLSGVGILVH